MNSFDKHTKKVIVYFNFRNSNNFFIMQPIEYGIQILNESMRKCVNIKLEVYSWEFIFQVKELPYKEQIEEILIGEKINENEENDIFSMIQALSRQEPTVSRLIQNSCYQIIVHEKKEITLH